MADIPTPPRPDLKITVGDKVYKMSYGLEMDIRRMLPDGASAIHLVSSDPYTQDYLVRRVLTDSKKIIMDKEELVKVEDVDLDSDEVEALLQWVVSHALYFFVKRTIGMADLSSQYRVSPPSSDGSPDSPSTTPSAGLSEL